jgi:hypothetical protein
MVENQFIPLFNRQIESFLICFSETLNDQEIKTVHLLRVAIKRINIIARLLKVACDREIEIKGYLNLFSKLFHKAGIIREIQINIKLIEKFDSNRLKPFYDYQIEELKLAVNEFHVELLAFNMDELKMKNDLLLQKFEDVSESELARTARKKIFLTIKRVTRLKDKSNKNLHEIRIKLNNAIGLLEIVNDLTPFNEFNKLLDDIKLIYKKIGVWHNYEVMIASLNMFEKKNRNELCIVELKREFKKIKKEVEKKQKKIGKQVKSYFKQVDLDQMKSVFLMNQLPLIINTAKLSS